MPTDRQVVAPAGCRLPCARCLLVAWCCCLPLAMCAAAAEPEVIRDVTYASPSDQPLLADVYLPAGEGPFPGVLVVHGGAWTFGNKSHLGFVARQLAQQGFTAVSINYRLAPQHKFPAQLEDCQAAVRWMRANHQQYRIDPARVAGYGYSAGGQLVALLGAGEMPQGETERKAPAADARLQAVVAGGAPCDFRLIASQQRTLAYWLGGTRGEQPEAYERASPACFVSSDDPPMLFFHGERDTLVDKSVPTAMATELKKAGVISEVLLLPNKGHVAAMFDPQAVTAAVAFLKKHLKSEKSVVSGQ